MAGLQLSDPFEGFEDMFKSMWRPVRFEMVAPAPSIKLELSETDDAYQVKAQIPGVNKDDIKVKIDGDTVSISAETKQQKEEKKNGKVIKSEFQYGEVSRAFSLDTDLDASKADAKYENGVLQLTLPKKPGSSAATLAVK
jgi:HSP20 family protein